MAIVEVREISPARERSIDLLAGWKRDYTRGFKVLTNDANQSIVSVSVGSAGGMSVPLLKDAHPNDARAYCVRKHVRQAGDSEAWRKLWVVSCHYSTLSKEQKKKLTHPLDRPYQINWMGETFQAIAELDLFGGGILNSAGQYFDPPVQVDNTRPVLTIVRNEATFDGELAFQYQDSINTGTFFGGAPYTVKCKKITANSVIEEFANSEGTEVEVEFWIVTYEFHYWYKTWWLFPLDQGRYEVYGDDLASIKDSEGVPVVDPVPLDGSGHKVPSSLLPQGAVYMTYRYYPELDFAAFNF